MFAWRKLNAYIIYNFALRRQEISVGSWIDNITCRCKRARNPLVCVVWNAKQNCLEAVNMRGEMKFSHNEYSFRHEIFSIYMKFHFGVNSWNFIARMVVAFWSVSRMVILKTKWRRKQWSSWVFHLLFLLLRYVYLLFKQICCYF